MKHYLRLTGLILFFVFSCNTKENGQSEPKTATNVTDSIKKETTTVTPNEEKSILDTSFIDKEGKEIEAYPIFECSGTLVENDSETDRYAVAIFTKNIEQCWNGKSKVVLEQFLDAPETQNRPYVIVDEINGTGKNKKRRFSTVYLNRPDNDKYDEKEMYLAEYEDNEKPVITKVYRIWEIDTREGKFKEVLKPQKLTFNNPDYIE
ncbi:hypothetical protein [Flavobacterium sp. CAU 1735]|uniref:hypothetical protein n=1 Tax=Flavobacterium sp. CAU 1735 TaxID=3140361 RepID=UPI0032605328